jgi:hypothetical protein
MNLKVVNVFSMPGEDFKDELLDPLGATLVKGMWMKEEEIIIAFISIYGGIT